MPPASPTPGTVLLVRHGKGRGRLYKYNQEFVHWLEDRRPALRKRLRCHFTGEPGPCLEGVAAVVFWTGDPLRELYPEEYRECEHIAGRARERGVRIVNPPESLSATHKSRVGRIWREAGLPTPPCRRFEDRPSFERAVRETDFPALVRGDDCHSQEGLRLFDAPEEALAAPHGSLPWPGVLTPFVDTREGWRRERPDALPARFFHKKRVLVYGDRVLGRNYYLSPEPIVGHPKHSLFGPAHQRSWLMGLLLGPPPLVRDALEAERAWIEAGPEAPDLFRRAVHALGLGFAAVDYATPAPGRVVLWEINPYPYLPPAHRSTLAGPRGLEREDERHYRQTAAWLEDLARGHAATLAGPWTGVASGSASFPDAQGTRAAAS